MRLIASTTTPAGLRLLRALLADRWRATDVLAALAGMPTRSAYDRLAGWRSLGLVESASAASVFAHAMCSRRRDLAWRLLPAGETERTRLGARAADGEAR